MSLSASHDLEGMLDELHPRLLDGDQQALSELFRFFHGRLIQLIGFRLDRSIVGRIGPDDVLQEAFLAASHRLSAYQTGTFTPYVWLRTIVLQTMTDLHRFHCESMRRASHREVGVEPASASGSSLSIAARLVSRWATPSQVVERAEMVEIVERVVGELDPADQEVLALRHVEELTNQEVAEVLGIQPKAASIRYVRALQRLRAELTRFPDFFE